MAVDRTVVVYVPDERNVEGVKVYQDSTSVIKAVRFVKESIDSVATVENSGECGIYLLVNKKNEVYVGKSVNGVGRIQEHVRSKEEWEEAVLFVSDNKRFDGLAIDYLEHRFIRNFTETVYEVVNKDNRIDEPNVMYTDKVKLRSYEEEILFLLRIMGFAMEKVHSFEEVIEEGRLDTLNRRKEKELYQDVIGVDEVELRFEPKSRLYTEPVFYIGGRFVLKERTKVQVPKEQSKEMGYTSFYTGTTRLVDTMIKCKKVENINGDLYTTEDIEFENPSIPAGLVSGVHQNGWDFYEGIRQVKQKRGKQYGNVQ